MGQVKNKPPSDLSGPPDPVYRLVDTLSELQDFARKAVEAEMVAVDLEADSMFHYREKVCLIQMAANGDTVVIDPLKVSDLTSLKPIFEDQRIVKVFHGADYDVRSLYRDFGIAINQLFDTQLASMYLGHPATSLESVVAQRFGVELNKKYQKKDWSRRPLAEEMAAYAAADVIYLIPLAKALIAELAAKGRLSWVAEGCLSLSRVRAPQTNASPLFLRFRGAGHLRPRQLAVLEALLQVRNGLAQQKDRPLFKVLGNTALLKIALAMPPTFEDLKATRILTPKQIHMYGQAVAAAVEQALRLPDAELPAYPRRKTPRMSPRIPPRVKALRAWRDQTALEMALDPALLLSKALISELAEQKPGCLEDLERVTGMCQWQIRAFGPSIIAALQKVP